MRITRQHVLLGLTIAWFSTTGMAVAQGPPSAPLPYVTGPSYAGFNASGGSVVQPASFQGMADTPASWLTGQGVVSTAQAPSGQLSSGQTPVGELGCTTCGGGYCRPITWFAEFGVRVLTRNRVRQTTLSVDSASSGRMTTKSVSFDIAAGFSATLATHLGRDAQNRDQYFEFVYWGMNQWAESEQVAGIPVQYSAAPFFVAGSLFSRFDPAVGGFNRADSHYQYQESSINNFEFNFRLRPRPRADRMVLHKSGHWRRQCQPGQYWSYLAGFRGMTLDERFNFVGRSTLYDGVNTTNARGDYVVKTSNDLLGFQLGIEMMNRDCLFSWGIRAKGGPFLDFALADSRITTSGTANDPFAAGDLDIHRRVSKTVVAAVGEVGIAAEYKFRSNMMVQFSYDFMWMTGISLAPEQLNYRLNAPSRINDNGTLHMHGLSAGLIWDF